MGRYAILRCMRRESAHRLVADTSLRRLRAIDKPHVRPAAELLTAHWELLLDRGDQLLGGTDEEQQTGIAAYADSLARSVMASLLLTQAPYEAGAGRGYRTLLVAHTYLHGLLGQRAQPPRSALTHLAQLADGGDVPADAALAALDTLAPRPAPEAAHAQS